MGIFYSNIDDGQQMLKEDVSDLQFYSEQPGKY